MALINKEQEYQDQEDWSNDVQKLKGYKEFKEKVEWWVEQTNIFGKRVIKGPYEIVYDNKLGWCVDIDGNVSFAGSEIKEIPFQFRNVGGFFDCREIETLTSLKGCPVYVGYTFDCHNCKNLTSLEGCPKEVGFNFWCKNCGKYFSEEYIRSLCDVKGRIFN